MPLSTPERELESYFDAMLLEGGDRSSDNLPKHKPQNPLQERDVESKESERLRIAGPSRAEADSQKANFSAKQQRFLHRLELAQMTTAFERLPGATRHSDSRPQSNSAESTIANSAALTCKLFRYFDQRLAISVKDIIAVIPLDNDQLRQAASQGFYLGAKGDEAGDLDSLKGSSNLECAATQPSGTEARAETVQALQALLDDQDDSVVSEPSSDDGIFKRLDIINAEAFLARFSGSGEGVLVHLRGRSQGDLGLLLTSAFAQSRLRLAWFRFPVAEELSLDPPIGSGVIGVMELPANPSNRPVRKNATPALGVVSNEIDESSAPSRLMLFDAGQYFRAQYAKQVLEQGQLEREGK